jgi:hypothetical protein
MFFCCLEQESQHCISPGVVQDDEMICRAAYAPMHIKKGADRSRIDISYLRKADIANNTLSVWRYSELSQASIQQIWDVCKQKEADGQKIWKLLFVSAREIRKPDAHRDQFCLLDECQVNETGGSHRAHAHISMCRRRHPAPIAELLVKQIRADLNVKFTIEGSEFTSAENP